MKREVQEMKYNGDEITINKIWTIFAWEKCWCCQKEFRRESGWCIIKREYVANIKYICAECCPTKEDAFKFLCKYYDDIRSKRPNPPCGGSCVPNPFIKDKRGIVAVNWKAISDKVGQPVNSLEELASAINKKPAAPEVRVLKEGEVRPRLKNTNCPNPSKIPLVKPQKIQKGF